MRIRTAYSALALMLMNGAILFVILNLVAGALLSRRTTKTVKDGVYFANDGAPVDDGRVMRYLLDWFDYAATPEISPKVMHDILVDYSRFADVLPVYLPWAQFSEPEFASNSVNVSRDGAGFPVRRTWNPQSRPGARTVRVAIYGGSTTFGYQMTDDLTWPSRLSQALNARAVDGVRYEVVNEGHCFFYSSQELALATAQWKTGTAPDIAIFLDGVNEGQNNLDRPAHTDALVGAFRLLQDTSAHAQIERLAQVARALPIVRLFTPKGNFLTGEGTGRPAASLREEGERMFRHYRFNVDTLRAAANAAGVRTYFVVQPDAFYNYPVELFRRRPPPSFFEERIRHARFHDLARVDGSLVYLGDLFEKWGASRKAIVDDVHYSPGFNAFLAERVADVLGVARKVAWSDQ